jgi:hypothetical protein
MSLFLGYIVTIIGYLIPLSIIYNFAYSREGGIMPMFYILFCTWLTGVLASLLYYRMGVLGESSDIVAIHADIVKSIMATNAASYMLVAITLFAISFNKGLVNIFENTLGYLYINMFGANELANEIFTSKKFGPQGDLSEFDYGFLLTRFSTENIKEFIENVRTGQDATSILPLDFELKLDNRAQREELEEFVYTKHRIGHFTWVYFTSIIALLISMVSIAMNY